VALKEGGEKMVRTFNNAGEGRIIRLKGREMRPREGEKSGNKAKQEILRMSGGEKKKQSHQGRK